MFMRNLALNSQDFYSKIKYFMNFVIKNGFERLIIR